MLIDFENILISNGLGVPTQISNLLANSNSSLLVYDFDSIKDKCCYIAKIGDTPKSVDYLNIDTSKSIINFIEHKDVDSLINNERSKYQTKDSFDEFLDRRFEKFGFENKIVDSVLLSLVIAGHHNISNSFFGFFIDKGKVEINFIIVSDISSQHYIEFSLVFMPKIERLKKLRMIKKVAFYKVRDFEKYYT